MFNAIKSLPLDPISSTWYAFMKDQSPKKINLVVGAYRDENGQPYLFNVVQKAQKSLIQNKYLHEYPLLEGDKNFCQASQKIIFGKNSQLIKTNRIATIQTVGGTGALSLAIFFLKQIGIKTNNICISKPSFSAYPSIIQQVEFHVVQYDYYNYQTKTVNIDAMLKSLSEIQQGSIVILQSAAHNPTGADPTKQQWKEVAKVMKKKKLFPFFDAAYQGFASGDLDQDALAIRIFVDQGFNEMLVAQSYSKNLGLYGQRVGALHVVVNQSALVLKVFDNLKQVTLKLYIAPPQHGAKIAAQIINNEELISQWKKQLKDVIASRVLRARKMLREEFERLKTPGNWSVLTQQKGMMMINGLSQEQNEILIKKYHIYVLKNGRMSLVGINEKNVNYIAQSLNEVLRQKQKKRLQNKAQI